MKRYLVLANQTASSSELADTITDGSARTMMEDFRRVAIGPDAIARAVAFAIGQPEDVDVNEILFRPVGQEF